MDEFQFSIRLNEDDPQALRIERHGYVNLINVVHAELQLIERMLDAPGSLRSTIFLAERASRAFKEPAFIDGHEESLCRFRATVNAAVVAARDEHDPKMQNSDVAEAVEILDSVIADAACRVQEVLARHRIRRPIEEHEGLALPVGLSETVERLALELQMHCTDDARPEVSISPTSVTVWCPSMDTERPFEPLSQEMPPSALHELIKNGASVLRPAMELYYHTVPGGGVRVRHSKPRFTLTADLALSP